MSVPQSMPNQSVSAKSTFRPPAVPLVTHTPFFSVWDCGQELTSEQTRHWTGQNNSLFGMIRVDGVPYRYSGANWNQSIAKLEQVSLTVEATSSTYVFQGAGIELTVEFLSPLLIDDIELLTRPVSYITYGVQAIDGKSHDVSLSLEICAEWCVQNSGQQVVGAHHLVEGLRVSSFRSVDQGVLKTAGDAVCIDWGTLYLAVPDQEGTRTSIHSQSDVRDAFTTTGAVPKNDSLLFPRPARNGWPSLAVSFSLGSVGATEVTRHAMVAYDEEFAVEYFHRKLRPYWSRQSADAAKLLATAASEYESVRARCVEFNAKINADLTAVGGEALAAIGRVAYRQCLAAHTIVEDLDGTLLMFSKENSSNGCMGTVDVTYPGSPIFLHYAPDLLRAQIEPVLAYSATSRWRFPFAPHDLGTYPLANGQVYGGGEDDISDQMPVEESGNMLVLTAAVCRKEGSIELASKYWSVLTQWADYLLEAGLDPDHQLCTDDFAGHLAHNTNLSIKAIVGLGCYAWMCGEIGDKERAAKVRKSAEEMAAKWVQMADDGDHYRLTFDHPDTWSQKYNLVWDRILDLNLFPQEVVRKEVAFYLTKLNPYGLPLDSRTDYTKLDWCVWTATLTENREDFDKMVEPLYKWANETPDRVPLSDWFWTKSGNYSWFKARSVVGGLFIPLLGKI